MADIGGTTLEREYRLHVLEVPAGMEDIDGSTVAMMALIVLSRQSGMLLALPVGVLSEEAIATGLMAESGDPIGLSHQVSVQAGLKLEWEDGEPPVIADGALVDVLLVDVSA